MRAKCDKGKRTLFLTHVFEKKERLVTLHMQFENFLYIKEKPQRKEKKRKVLYNILFLL